MSPDQARAAQPYNGYPFGYTCFVPKHRNGKVENIPRSSRAAQPYNGYPFGYTCFAPKHRNGKLKISPNQARAAQPYNGYPFGYTCFAPKTATINLHFALLFQSLHGSQTTAPTAGCWAMSSRTIDTSVIFIYLSILGRNFRFSSSRNR